MIAAVSIKDAALPRILSDDDVAGFRDRLCEAAARIFVERGREGFNMRELAARLGVSAMTPYRYFKDKDEILAAVRARGFERFAARLEAAQAAPATAPEEIEALPAAYLRFVTEEPESYRLLFDLTQPREDSFLELAAAGRRLRATLARYAQKLVETGVYKGDPGRIGQALWASLHGLAALHLAGKIPEPGEFAAVRQEVLAAFHRAYATR